MPIYEYRCRSCHRQFSVLHRTFNVAGLVACRHCGGADVERLVSKVALLRSQESGREDMGADSDLDGVDEGDPRSMARWARKMGRELGEEAGPEWDEMVGRMEDGELPPDSPDAGADLGEDS